MTIPVPCPSEITPSTACYIERMVFGKNGHPLAGRAKRQVLFYRPRQQYTVTLESEVVV